MALYDSKNVSCSALTLATFTKATDWDNQDNQSGVLQAQLATNAGFRIYCGFNRTPTVADNDGMLLDGQTLWFPAASINTIVFLITGANGVGSPGGANDYVLVRGSVGQQSVH